MASGDEGEHVLGVGGDDFQHVGFLGREHAAHRGGEIFFVHHPLAFHAKAGAHGGIIGVNGLGVVRVAEVGVAAVAFIKAILPLHYHAEVLIV